MQGILAGLAIIVSAAAADLPVNLQRLAGLASSLPPEFQADTLLQIVESRGGLDPALKRDLLEQASVMARQAKYPYPKVAVRGLNADSRQAFEANALSLKLDRLSLEMRAIRAMLALDATAARRAFQQTPKPAPATGTCSDALIPELEDYFDAGALVVSRGFTAKELAREEHVALALQIVTSVKAPYEVGPAARLIATAKLSTPQFETVLNAFTARLEAIGLDDRAFGESVLSAQREIATLAGRAETLGASRATLARAYRKYLTSHYTAPRCADGSAGRGSTGPAEGFNQSSLRGSLAIIEAKELTAKDVDGKLQLDAFWSTPDSERILKAAQALRTSPSGIGYSVEERQSTDWNQKLQDFLAQLSDWKQTGEESSLDFFHEKATVYESLIDICPPGDGRQRLMNAFVGFLNSGDASGGSAVDWFWHVQNVYRRLRQAGDKDAARLMAAFQNSGNVLLDVYARLNGQ